MFKIAMVSAGEERFPVSCISRIREVAEINCQRCNDPDELVKFASDAIRINLSNEDCHNNIIPYYMNNYVTADALAELQASFTWTEF